jgi:hypothetical protein
VWDDYRVPGYLKPGTYRWEGTVYVAEQDPDSNDSEDSTEQFDWGFGLELA